MGAVVAAFFLILSVLAFGVSTSLSWRAGLHNGCWVIKIGVLVTAIAAMFLVPSERMERVRPGKVVVLGCVLVGGEERIVLVLFYAAFVASFAFIIIQMVLLVDCTHMVTEKL